MITELAFIADEQVNTLAEGDGQRDVDTPLEVQFNDFVDGGNGLGYASCLWYNLMMHIFSVNSRGKGTKTRQRKMTVEQAAAVLLVMVAISFFNSVGTAPQGKE